MTHEEFKKLTAEPLIVMRNVDAVARNRDVYYIGKMDAATEWNDSPETAKKLFLHTETYNNFLNPDSLILLGRTGTGKTAILQCLKEDVQSGNVDEYKFAISLELNSIINEIGNFSEIDNSWQTRLNVKEAIEWIINVNVMTNLILNYKFGEELQEIYSYLKEIKVLVDDTPANTIRRVTDIFVTLPGWVGNVSNAICKAATVVRELKTVGYKKALNQLYEFAKEHKILVLMDSLNEYDLCDNKTVIVIKAIVANCFQYYNNRAKWGIYLKFAIPSEIYTHILSSLPGKQRGNTVVIRWSCRDLINFIAKRFYYYMSNSQDSAHFEFLDKYNLADFSESSDTSYKLSANLLHGFLPQNSPTNQNFKFDTLAYCIKHTQKKPRELIDIFNALIDEIVISRNTKFFIENPNKIKQVIHSTQETMFGSALSMYNETYPDIEKACSTVLLNRNFLFQGRDLDNRLKEAVSNRGYNIQDITRVLLESGLIGVVTELDTINLHNPKMENEKEITVVFARFEYQIKGALMFDRNEYYVIHPMCYEHFTCRLNPNVLVYVDRNSDNYDIINTILRKE